MKSKKPRKISVISWIQSIYPILFIILLWPAFVNGTAFFFPDSSAYIRAGDAVVYYTTGHASEWSNTIRHSLPHHQTFDRTILGDAAKDLHPQARVIASNHSSFDKTILLGRSVYYGFIAYLGILFNSFWIPLIVQALACGMVIVGAARHIFDPKAEPTRFAQLVLSLILIGSVTSLPYFASFLMPDVFTGLLLLTAALVLVGWQRERLTWRIFWFALLCVCALVHATNILILACLAPLTILLAKTLSEQLPWKGAGLLLLAAAIGVVGNASFDIALQHALHRPAVRPPFLSARLIADGPGAAYLRDSCPKSGFALCAYRYHAWAGSDSLLWNPDPAKGVFTPAPVAEQVRMARQDRRFAFAVLMHYPVWTIETAMKIA